MNKWFSFGTMSLALLLVGWGGYQLGHRNPSLTPSSASEDPTDKGKVLYWYDPMVPGQRFDKPGKSPFMDMELVPRYADNSGNDQDAGVTISARQQQNLGVTLARVEQRMLSNDLAAYGTVAVNERTLTTLSSPSTGIIEQLKVRALQQHVERGEILAVIWNPSWSNAQQEYLAVRSTGDTSLIQATRERLAFQFIPETVIRQVEQSGKVQPRMTITAPRTGYISRLDVREGQQITAAQPLFELAGLETVWIIVDYPQSQASLIQIGDQVSATNTAWPGVIFDGTVSELLPELDATTRNLRARITLNNSEQRLKPGMYLEVSRVSAPSHSTLMIPQAALISTGEKNHVLLAEGNGHFIPTAVRIGGVHNEWVEVLDGLKEGQQVVTSSQFLIDSEASLRNVLPQFSTQSTPTSSAVLYHTTGIIKGIQAENITITHQPIPELNWGMMTMDFTLPQEKLPKNVQVGSEIQLSFTMDEHGIVIQQVAPVASHTSGGH